MKENGRDYSARKEGHAKWVKRLQEPEQVEKRFWKKVKIGGPDECWPWIGGYSRKRGYGSFHYQGKIQAAHRIAYVLSYGEFDRSLHCLHKCDQPRCQNPKHLFLGTHQDNMDDKMSKGRHRCHPTKGVENGFHKLTENQVKAIRSEYIPQRGCQARLAEKYGVTHRNISAIVERRSWKHI